MSDSSTSTGERRGSGSQTQLRVRPFDLFPTRIWQARLVELDPLLPQWVAAAHTLQAASPIPQKRSIRGGWASGDLEGEARTPFEPLLQAIGGGCGAALQDVGWAGGPFRLQAWLNIQETGGFNFLHMHVGALLTGCFYLQAPPGAGALVLRDPRPGVLHGALRGDRPNGLVDVRLPPEAGLLRIFPPWLEHFVEPNGSETPRITLAFNALAIRAAET